MLLNANQNDSESKESANYSDRFALFAVVICVQIIETPPMIVVGMVGLVQTPSGKRSITSLWASHMDDSFKRRYYKNWYVSFWQNALRINDTRFCFL